jgi:hypothetical protein
MHRLALVILILVASARAATITVATDGSGQYMTISEAITAASAGDDIRVKAGTYFEHLNCQGVDLTIRQDSISDTVIVDGDWLDRCLTCSTGETSATQFIGIVFRDGDTTGDGGCVYISGASPTFSQCTFDGCESTLDGGGVYISNGDSTFTDCVWSDCSGDYGGGMRVVDGAGSSSVTITNGVFAANAASEGEAISTTSATPPSISGSTMCDHYQGFEVEGTLTDAGQNMLGIWCCDGDVDWDGDVDVNDLVLQITAFGSEVISGDDREDITRNSVVDTRDLLLLLANWGGCN